MTRMVLGSRPRERAQGQVVPAPSIACHLSAIVPLLSLKPHAFLEMLIPVVWDFFYDLKRVRCTTKAYSFHRSVDQCLYVDYLVRHKIYIYMFMCVRPITLYGVIIIIVVVVSIIVVSYMIHQGRARALQKEPQLQLRWQSRELIVWGWSGPKAALGQFGFSDISCCALVWMFINVLGQLQRSSRRVGFLWPLNFETSISKPYCEEII
jgi:hypothetical protein